ncbi:ABC transporter permease [Mucilaginibacter sp. RS28]|uniref:ABC transporter permease n=1 Tax=Mucilaginibacter straminoryzae TaxID=2932774 RepID=A0A9X1X4F5_9SPHI|nr:ABC transporter permease [Mucilaginibacter straminoryzae]MCJ8210791.1 ABC transporter permease [Mucilaginibacter straminoryzae]
MKGFWLSFRSEFYKSRKTLGFWGSILLPLLICMLVFWGTYAHSEKMQQLSGTLLWLQLSGGILNIMGVLLLPMYIIFLSYSVNNIEHKSETWKTLFSLPIPKWSVYSAKYAYAFMLLVICLSLFFSLTIATGYLLELVKPELKFHEGSISESLLRLYIKLFFNSLGILSIQFLLSLLWSDFIKPMGVGFLLLIASGIGVGANWKYIYLVPYAHPMLAIMNVIRRAKASFGSFNINVVLLTRETYVSFIVAAVVFVAGFFIVQKRSVR